MTHTTSGDPEQDHPHLEGEGFASLGIAAWAKQRGQARRRSGRNGTAACPGRGRDSSPDQGAVAVFSPVTVPAPHCGSVGEA